MLVSAITRPKSISPLVRRRTLSTLAPVSIIETLAFGSSFLIAFDIPTASA